MYTTTPWINGAHIPAPGQVLAVAMPDRRTLIVGTEHEMRVFDPTSGELTHLHHTPSTEWLQPGVPNMIVPDERAHPRYIPAFVEVLGHVGGELPRTTGDQWGYNLQPHVGRIIANLTHDEHRQHPVAGAGDHGMAGFSGDGLAFVLMTSGGLYTAYRDPLA